jgi:two-component system response regulator AtoC
MPSILVIEDEAVLRRQIARALERAGHEVHVAELGADGLVAVNDVAPDLVLLDLRLPDCSGLEVLSKIHEIDAEIPVVLMTAHGSVGDAVDAMRRGAVDYLQKPLDLDELQLLVERAVSRGQRDRELAYHRDRARALPDGIVGSDPDVLQIFTQVERLKEADLPPGRRPALLLTGETGTGKGIIARAIHELLGGGPFIEMNCTALPASLVEAELFGHERGTFTDAKTSRTGLFEAGEGGSIFLDEIGHAPLELQAKLLKVLEDKRVRRLGSSVERSVNVHVMAATNRDLDLAVENGEFRNDLLHRLRVLAFEIAPLRARPDDIPLLARHFCREIGQLYGRKIQLDPDAERYLQSYPWPGNVRELRNVIERSILLQPGDTLGPKAFASLQLPPTEATGDEPFTLPEGGVNLAELEREMIRQALERAGGNRTRAAALLGLTRDTLRYRLDKFDLG